MIRFNLFVALMVGLFLSSSETNANESREVCFTNTEAENRYASYSPDGQHILFESNRSGNWDIYMMLSDGSAQEQLTTHNHDDRRPSWHPSGEAIVFESNRDGRDALYTLSLGSGEIDQLKAQNSQPGTYMFARYSPDSKEIAVSIRESENKANIAILDHNGAFKKWVTYFKQRSFYPNWSSDGGSLVFHSRKDTDNKDDEIYQWNRVDNKLTRITHWPTHNFCPAWSPDGERIAYARSMQNTRPEIFVMGANGEKHQQITFNDDGDTLPNWSPDSSSLLITAYRNGHYQICTIAVN